MGDSTTKGKLSSYFNKTRESIKGAIPELNSIQVAVRQRAVQLNPNQPTETLKLQLAIKALGSVTHDHNALARDSKIYSKQLYLWGRDEKGRDLVDVVDRLAFLMFKKGELEETYAKRLEEARGAMKDVRNFENDLIQKKSRTTTASNRLASFQSSHPRPNKTDRAHMIKLESELATLRTEDSHLESTLEVLKRTRLRESFSIQFAAQKELGEKMALLAEYGDLLVREMEKASVAEKEGAPYEGEEATSLIVTQATEALHTWTPASAARRETDLKTAETSESQEVAGASDLHRAKTISFGAAYATELSELPTITVEDHSSPPPLSPSLPSATVVPPPSVEGEGSSSSTSDSPAASGSANITRMATAVRNRLQRSEAALEGDGTEEQEGELPAYGEDEDETARAVREAEEVEARQRESNKGGN